MVDHPSNQIKEHPITAVFHMATGEHDHTAIFNGMGDTVDYIDVNGERFERAKECERIPYYGNGKKQFVCSLCGCGIGKQIDKYVYVNHCPACGARITKDYNR